MALATVIIDPPTALIFGALLALVSTRLIARDAGRAVLSTGMWGATWGVIYGLCVGWMYFHYPDWMFLYLRDARTTPLVPLYAGFLVLMALGGGLGGLSGAALIANGKKAWAWALLGGALLLLFGFWWMQWDQYMRIGTLDEYLHGRAKPFGPVGELALPINLTTVFSTGSALVILVRQVWLGRRKPS